MTEPMFYANSYLRSFTATVLSLTEGGGVVLDRTCFYPGGGGQPCDLGTLQVDGMSVPVISVDRHRDLIVHRIEGSLISPGMSVAGTIDWERRYLLMRMHTALHILCGVIWNTFERRSTGCDMQPGAAHIDFELDAIDRQLTERLEQMVNREILAARPTRVSFRDRAWVLNHPTLIKTKVDLLPKGLAEVRIVDIDGLDVQADGGTHVHTTSEVGGIRIVRHKSKGRQNKRIYVELIEAPFPVGSLPGDH